MFDVAVVEWIPTLDELTEKVRISFGRKRISSLKEIRIAVWNDGKQELRLADIPKCGLVFSFAGCSILELGQPETSRQFVDASTSQQAIDAVSLTFEYLNRRDAVAFTVLVDTHLDIDMTYCNITMLSDIIGSRTPLPSPDRPRFPRRIQFALFVGYLISVAGIVFASLLLAAAIIDPAGYVEIKAVFIAFFARMTWFPILTFLSLTFALLYGGYALFIRKTAPPFVLERLRDWKAMTLAPLTRNDVLPSARELKANARNTEP